MSTPQPELIGVLADWFRCPHCGDAGETSQTIFSDIGTLRFVCQNTDHRPVGDEEQHYRVSDAIEDTHQSLVSKLGFGGPEGRLGETRACVRCPTCESTRTDGALEWLVFGLDDAGARDRLQVFVVTVWCDTCESVARSWLARDGLSDAIPSDAVETGSEYPPAYIR